MSALVIDTSSWISYFAGNDDSLGELIDEGLRESRVYLPPLVAAELLSGAVRRRDSVALKDLLTDLPVCPTPLAHWFRVGELRHRLRSKGLAVSTPDSHIAQCALDLNAQLLTEDEAFRLIARHVPLRLADGG
ncbi:MAG: PIN domain-containing protein [Myxococcota bacterium]